MGISKQLPKGDWEKHWSILRFLVVEPSSPGEESEDWGQKPHHEKWAFADWCSVLEASFHSLPTCSSSFFWSQFILCHLLWPHNLGQLFLLFGPIAVRHCSISVPIPWDCYLLLRYPWLSSDRAKVVCIILLGPGKEVLSEGVSVGGPQGQSSRKEVSLETRQHRKHDWHLKPFPYFQTLTHNNIIATFISQLFP